MNTKVLAVFHPNTPSIKRVVRRNGQPIRANVIGFVHWQKPARALASIAGPSQSFVGQRVQLSITGNDSVGSEREVSSPTWTSLDTNRAVVDHLGVATLRTVGAATFRASASGVISPTFSTAVRPVELRPAFTERWQTALPERWILFGTPTARSVRQGTHTSLLLDGDGHLTSGVVSKQTLDASAGVGVRVWLRAPVRIAQWQMFAITLGGVASNSALAEWPDHSRRDGATPTSWNTSSVSRSCSIRAPRGEFGENMALFALHVAGEDVPIPVAVPRLTDGRHTLLCSRSWETDAADSPSTTNSSPCPPTC